MTDTREITLRTAGPDDAAPLSALALLSKAHWGYDADFLERCRDELTVREAEIAAGNVVLAEAGGRILAFFGIGELEDAPGDWDVLFFFVSPQAIGGGIGRQLWQALQALARERGARRIVIVSDPQAEGFYRRMGARRIGDTASSVDPQRRLPLLVVDLEL